MAIYLGRGNNRLQTLKAPGALITFINVPTPSTLIIRFMLSARTCKLISVLTPGLGSGQEVRRAHPCLDGAEWMLETV